MCSDSYASSTADVIETSLADFWNEESFYFQLGLNSGLMTLYSVTMMSEIYDFHFLVLFLVNCLGQRFPIGGSRPSRE